MIGTLSPQDVIERYAVYADVLGRDRAVEEDAAAPVRRQAAYSLLWFYRHLAAPDQLNGITRAYLGDADAQGALHFGEAGERSFADALLEGAHPLNASQVQAVARALESDLSLVQGPPGTGKTETILNMALCMVARGKTVAVVANNGKAIDNIQDKIEAWRRAGEDALGPNQRRLVRSFANLGNSLKRRAWADGHAGSDRQLAFASGKELTDRFGCGGWEPRIRAAEFLARYPFITSTIHSLKKCFRDGDTYQFDYVIMDEASQCNPLLALVAMSSARHLVLVGDIEQLPPIYTSDFDDVLAQELADADLDAVTDPRFSLQDGETGAGLSVIASVERACAGLGVPHTFLNEHYRCHPGIISFSNENVYAPGGSPLVIKTPSYDRDVETPIRVRWFEGNYCEPYVLAGKPRQGEKPPRKLTRTNARQLEIFMTEEWPDLKRRLEEDEALSVCVLSPYRGLLHELGKRLNSEGVQGAQHVSGERGDDPTAVPEIPTFTIHKSQGQEFDIVYLMPGEDGAWEWPWTEAKPLINVAVSRAKRELVIIASTSLMSPETQAALVGEDRVVAFHESQKGKIPDEERERRAARERFLEKLIDYVRVRNDPATHPDGPTGFPASTYAFGFHRAKMRSVFDAIPLITGGRPANIPMSPSAPERALEAALKGVHLTERGLAYRAEVPLSECVDNALLKRGIDVDTPRLRSLRHYIFSNARFDFVIFERESGRIRLIIEVDGAQHRSPMGRVSDDQWDGALKSLAERQDNDLKKDQIIKNLGGYVLASNRRVDYAWRSSAREAGALLLRLPTDGTIAFETRSLADAMADGSDFLSIEELLDDLVTRPRKVRGLLPLSDEAPDAPHPSLSALIKMWKAAGDADAQRFNGLLTTKANAVLVRAGYIEKDAEGTWHVTERGRGIGIHESVEWFEAKGFQTVLRYAPESADVVRRTLLEGLA